MNRKKHSKKKQVPLFSVLLCLLLSAAVFLIVFALWKIGIPVPRPMPIFLNPVEKFY